MKKIILGTLFVALLLAGCGGGKYSEVENVFNQMITATENFGNSFKSADASSDAKAVAQALGTYAETISKLQPKLAELQKKFPELAGSDMPKELEALQKKLETKTAEFTQVFANMAKYMMDTEVMKAMEKMQGM